LQIIKSTGINKTGKFVYPVKSKRANSFFLRRLIANVPTLFTNVLGHLTNVSALITKECTLITNVPKLFTKECTLITNVPKLFTKECTLFPNVCTFFPNVRALFPKVSENADAVTFTVSRSKIPFLDIKKYLP
jgi:hypothetical protein